jgi:hypothetical protein
MIGCRMLKKARKSMHWCNYRSKFYERHYDWNIFRPQIIGILSYEDLIIAYSFSHNKYVPFLEIANFVEYNLIDLNCKY